MGERFDPYGVLQALDARRVQYVLIGGFARVVQGTEELTRGIDLTPSTRAPNLERLAGALDDIGARRRDGGQLEFDAEALVAGAVLELETAHGEVKIVAEPAGTRGYADLRRAASREPLGRGSRPAVASVGDLARMLSALGDEQRLPQLMQLRRITELERSRARMIER